MVNNRPGHLDLRGEYPHNHPRYLGDLPSPGVGEIPPALSPLDAFALQSKLLAQKFEEEKKNGRRMSRLPPLTIANELGKPRPGYFRSVSAGSENATDDRSDAEEEKPQSNIRETRPEFRPRSQYPLIQSDSGLSFDREHFRNNLAMVEESAQSREASPKQLYSQDYISIPRAQSPEPIDTRLGVVEEPTPISPPDAQRNYYFDAIPSQAKQRSLTVDSASSQRQFPGSLAPPRSPAPSRSPRGPSSIRSVNGEGSDVEGLYSMGGSMDSLPPRLSPNPSLSRSQSPFSPYQQIPRSPSVSSEFSVGGSRLPKPAFNFSRPLSRGGRPSVDSRPSVDLPTRQASGESSSTRPSTDYPSRQGSGDSPVVYGYDGFNTPHTPLSMTSEEYNAASDPSGPAPSYIYSKYALPRGRALQRESICVQDYISNQIQWDKNDQALEALTPTTSHISRPPTPPSPRSLGTPSSQARPLTAGNPSTRDVHRSPSLRPKSSGGRSAPVSPSLAPSNSSTIKAQMGRSRPTSNEMTPEDHLDKGIECHEQGSLNESTYHLRIAARAGLPTGMLLYALACRHGWGMRPNPTEAVHWLRKAVDHAQLEVADDENQSKQGRPSDVLEKKAHKAQFALSVYELGVSYMNGWGIQQDKSLALRCFEIAGSWGDADALAEAGFCYTEGIGCKKNLKKAAKFYRMAAAKGMSMAGNAWIYKEKYMDDDDNGRGRSSNRDESQKKPRDKSRTRTIFGRKKSTAAS